MVALPNLGSRVPYRDRFNFCRAADFNARPAVFLVAKAEADIFEASGKMPDSWYEGYLARLTIEDRHVRFEAIPYIQSQASAGAQKMNKSARKRFLYEMQRKSNQKKDAVFLGAQRVNYCREQKGIYLSALFG